LAVRPPPSANSESAEPTKTNIHIVSTTLALLTSLRYAHTKITLLDPYLPSLSNPPSSSEQQQPTQNPHAASIDSSRIIRPDYAVPAYARLALTAQQKWRNGYGKRSPDDIVYRESGVILTAEQSGSEYVDRARENARVLGCDVQALKTAGDVERVLGTGGVGGESGYVNWGSGWVDAAGAMDGVMMATVERARERGNVVFQRGKAKSLTFSDALTTASQHQQGSAKKKTVTGALLDSGPPLHADLTILAAGAWSPSLIPLHNRADARAQIIAYLPLTPHEASRLSTTPVLLNLSTGMFVIPPIRDPLTGHHHLKIARHGYGYANPVTITPSGLPENPTATSLPHPTKFSPIPPEGLRACRAFLSTTIPWLSTRAFGSSRICWYTDTPTGDFLVDWHPGYGGLFLATGGSGHGFKFLPVLGGRVVEGVEGRLDGLLADLWRWRGGREGGEGFGGTEDGSRGGERGMVLEEEWAKEEEGGMRSKL